MLQTINTRDQNISLLYSIDQLKLIRREPESNTVHSLWENLKPLQVKHEETVIATAQWLGKSKFINRVSYALVPTAENQHHVILNFALADSYAENFVLLRGLFDFGRPSFVAVTGDRTTQTYSVALSADEPVGVAEYFETIFNWLTKEIKFKVLLKEVVKFEQRIKREQALVYANLRAVV